jgi:hypothetical protein
MRTSISNIIRTERFLLGECPPSEKLAFESRLLLDSELRSDTHFHQMVHRLVKLYHRRKLRREVDALHERLFGSPEKKEFRDSIVKLFNS